MFRLLRIGELVQENDGALPGRRQSFLHLVENERVRSLHRFRERHLGLLVILLELLPTGIVFDTLDETCSLSQQLSHQRDLLEQEPALKRHVGLRIHRVRSVAAVALALQSHGR